MNKYELIFAAFVVILLMGFFTSCSFQQKDCVKEAIKANVDPKMINVICR